MPDELDFLVISLEPCDLCIGLSETVKRGCPECLGTGRKLVSLKLALETIREKVILCSTNLPQPETRLPKQPITGPLITEVK